MTQRSPALLLGPWLALAACQAAPPDAGDPAPPAEAAAVPQAPAPGDLTLSGPVELFAGVPATLTVTGVPAGRPTALLASAATSGPLACPRMMRPTCLELFEPARVIGVSTADGAGVAVYDLTVPVGTPVSIAHLQAATVDGAGEAYTSQVLTLDVFAPTGDPDGDGLSSEDEIDIHGTDWLDPDTDDDGIMDGAELLRGTDPLDADTDGDGVDDGAELFFGTDPLDPSDV